MLRLATKFAPLELSAHRRAKQCGYDSAELWLDAAQLEGWRDALDAAVLPSYALHFPNKKQLEQHHLSQFVQLYHTLDCQVSVIHAPLYAEYGSAVLEIDSSLRLAVENHRFDEDEFWRWAGENAWLTLDVEHLWKFTVQDGPLSQLCEYLQRFLEKHGEQLAHVHLPGYLPTYPEHRPMYCSRDMVLATLSALHQSQFDGLVVSEVRQDFQNPFDLKMDALLFDHWRQSIRSSAE